MSPFDDTDGWSGYSNLVALGYSHESVVLDGDTEKAEQALPMIHLVFSNLKAWLLGTHHGSGSVCKPDRHGVKFNSLYLRFIPQTTLYDGTLLASYRVDRLLTITKRLPARRWYRREPPAPDASARGPYTHKHPIIPEHCATIFRRLTARHRALSRADRAG